MTSFRTLPFCVLVKTHPLCNVLLIGSKVFCVYATAKATCIYRVELLSCAAVHWVDIVTCVLLVRQWSPGTAQGHLTFQPNLVWLLILCVLTVHICLRATLPRSRRPSNRALTCEPGLSGLIWLCAALFTGPGWLTCSQCDMFSLQCSRIEHILTGCNQHSHPHRACHRHRTPLSRVLLLRCCRCRCGLDGFVVYTTA